MLAVAALALAGCATGQQPGSAGSSASGSAGPPTPTATGQPTGAGQPSASGQPIPGGTGVLVQFRRQGGIAGVSDYLVVQQDGGYTLTRTRPAVTKTGRLSATDLADLRKMLAETDFAHMPRVQSAKGADLFMYQVIYGDVEIAAMDGGMVEPLKPVVATLSGLVARYS